MKWLAQWDWRKIGVWLFCLTFSLFCWWLIVRAITGFVQAVTA